MATATISGHGNNVTFELMEREDEIALADDVGKASLNYLAVGREDPKSQDNLSAVNTITARGIIEGSNAYADAKTVAEDIIKPRPADATPITLDVSSLPSYSGTIDVFPNDSSACTLTYVPGQRNIVGIELSLIKINSLSSASGQDAQTFSSPDAGSGVKIEKNGTSVTLSDDLTVTRRVGRPPMKKKEGALSTVTELPKYFDMNTPASDVFELNGVLLGSSPAADAQTLRETIMRPILGQDTLALHFLDGLYGLDQYPVVPDGSQAVRTIFKTGQTGINEVPVLQLRVVDNS